MAKAIQKVLVVGTGKVGKLVAILLNECGFEVTGLDHKAQKSRHFESIEGDVTQGKTIASALKGQDAVVTCLPYHLNLKIAEAAHKAGIHYFDLTEDVPTTKAIRKLAETSKGVMAPQCGLAPGFIGIVGASITEGFTTLRSIELRVGALPQHPKGLLGYAFNWSSEGVVNEYLNDCEIIHEGIIKMVPAMQDIEKIVIKGNTLEAFTTSGGLGTMCETFAEKVDELTYKTMRYPGHCKLMRFFFHELLMKEDRIRAGEILVNAKPPVNDDVVYVHAAVEGKKRGKLWREEFVRAYYPIDDIGGTSWRAISWTTAASIVAVVEMVAKGVLPQKGFIKQEEIPLEDFLNTQTGRLYKEHGQH